MARYREPAAASSPYITEAGFARLRAELASLWAKRRDVVAHLSAAAAEGDRSENAEYIYRKKQLREIDRRVGYLQRRLPTLKVVDQRPAAERRAYFGAWVTLRDAAGASARYRIVGADEIEPERNWISVDSPTARALLGREAGDTLDVPAPAGRLRYQVVEVDYAPRRADE